MPTLMPLRMFANFTPILKKIRINLVLSYMIYMCKLQNNKCDWSADHYIVDNEIRNVVTRTLFFNFLKKSSLRGHSCKHY